MPNPPPSAVLLSATQRNKVTQLVKLQHAALIVEMMGDKAVPMPVLAQIKAAGLYRKPRPDVIFRSFAFGREGIINPKVLSMTDAQFARYMARKGSVMTPEERVALKSLRASLKQYLGGLADKMTDDLQKALEGASTRLRRKLEKHPDANPRARRLEAQKAMAEMGADLARVTRKQLSNAQAIIKTHTNNAVQGGRAAEILRKAGGGDPLVFKRPRPGACSECVDAYTVDGTIPRVFKLSELMDNGSNIGKSRSARMPVIESYHPHCACTLHMLSPGFGFDRAGKQVYVGRRRT